MQYYLIRKIFNSIALLLWTGLFFKISLQFTSDYQNYIKSDITQDIKSLRIVQIYQSFQILIDFMNRKSITPIINNIKLFIRLLIVFYFLQPTTDQNIFAFFVISCSIWQCICRTFSLFYVSMGELYHNSSMLLYPIQVYYSYCIIKNYYDRHYSQITGKQNVFIWGCIVLHIGYSIYSFVRQWESREKYYKDLKRSAERAQKNN